MSKKTKQKFYVVWNGVIPGIYDTWNECRLQVQGYTGARYKSFPTKEMAQEAYSAGPDAAVSTLLKTSSRTSQIGRASCRERV